jgi:uncharacterized damage-inducible protein DinB
MPAKPAPVPDFADSLLNTFAINDRINVYLIRAIDPAAWQLDPPGGKGRGLAALFAHIHNVRLMWLKAAGFTGEIPAKLENTSTQDEAIAALESSAAAIADILRRSFEGDRRIKGFKPDAAAFLGYLIAHDAHHRGQASLIARQLGHPISKSANFGMWEWGTR